MKHFIFIRWLKPTAMDMAMNISNRYVASPIADGQDGKIHWL